jgi:hypothetical protein
VVPSIFSASHSRISIMQTGRMHPPSPYSTPFQQEFPRFVILGSTRLLHNPDLRMLSSYSPSCTLVHLGGLYLFDISFLVCSIRISTALVAPGEQAAYVSLIHVPTSPIHGAVSLKRCRPIATVDPVAAGFTSRCKQVPPAQHANLFELRWTLASPPLRFD